MKIVNTANHARIDYLNGLFFMPPPPAGDAPFSGADQPSDIKTSR